MRKPTLREALTKLLNTVETSAATAYGDINDLHAQDRHMWVEAITDARRALGLKVPTLTILEGPRCDECENIINEPADHMNGCSKRGY